MLRIVASVALLAVSTSGAGALIVDVALEAKRLGLPVIALISVEHCRVSAAGHSSGKKLTDVADLVLDNCAVPGDAMVHVEGLRYPVGPGSTIGNTAIINAVKCEVARILTEGGQPPCVLTHGHFIGADASKEVFDRAYDDYRRRVPAFVPALSRPQTSAPEVVAEVSANPSQH